jgi:hypothetical protein
MPNPGIERRDGKGFAVAVGFPGKEVSGLAPRQGNPGRLEEWIAAIRATDLLHLHAFTRGLDLDKEAVHAAVTLPYHRCMAAPASPS